MIKIPNEVRAQIRRFPMVYRVQAENACVYAMTDAIDISCDASIMASVLALIEVFGWGTGKSATRIPRFMAEVQKNMDKFAERDGDAMAEGMRARLHNYGVEYKR